MFKTIFDNINDKLSRIDSKLDTPTIHSMVVSREESQEYHLDAIAALWRGKRKSPSQVREFIAELDSLKMIAKIAEYPDED